MQQQTTTHLTPEQKLFQIESLHAAVRTLENAMFLAYFSSGGTAYNHIHQAFSICLASVTHDIRSDKCPDGSEPNSAGMCEFPAGSGNWVSPQEAANLALGESN